MLLHRCLCCLEGRRGRGRGIREDDTIYPGRRPPPHEVLDGGGNIDELRRKVRHATLDPGTFDNQRNVLREPGETAVLSPGLAVFRGEAHGVFSVWQKN